MAVTPEEHETPSGGQRFGTWLGVYRPTLLAILGGQLFLREGWLVGNAGLVGALAVIFGAFLITGTTALSLSSIATNTRVKAGGPFAIIAQALGLEAGGAIGIPLFIGQVLSSAMYLFAFGEAWSYLFPGHDVRLVLGVSFVIVSLLAWRSAELALKTQGVLLFAVVAALTSVLLGVFVHPLHVPVAFSDFPDASLAQSFALFFPAATGITVGAGMSGQLADPRRSIPRGTLAAWATTLVVYVVFACWCAVIADRDTLLNDYMVMVDKALWGPVVLFGIAVLNLLAAQSMLIAAPRLLAAMAEQQLVPGSGFLAKLDRQDEPSRAVIATAIGAALCMSAGSLDAIAPVVTGFYIVTYLAINLVVWLEYSLGMISFRPTFAVGPKVPLVGMVLCLLAVVRTSPFGGVLELGLVVAVYVWLGRRKLETPWETVHSGIDVSIAAWAARRTAGMDRGERAWKPDLLAVVDRPEELSLLGSLLAHLGHAHGSVKLVGIGDHPDLEAAIPAAGASLQATGVYTTWTRLHTATAFEQGAPLAVEALLGSFFPPNLVLVDGDRRTESDIQAVVDRAIQLELGTIVALGLTGPLPPGATVAVWLSDRSPDWNLRLHNANMDLPVLLAYLVSSSTGGRLRLATVVQENSHKANAEAFLARLCEMGRLPTNTRIEAVFKPFIDAVAETSGTDLHFFGLAQKVQLDRLQAIQRAARAPCLFTLDSGRESVLA
jgi:amino acid transporter